MPQTPYHSKYPKGTANIKRLKRTMRKTNQAPCNNWIDWKDGMTRARHDPCSHGVYVAESVRPGEYKLNTPGYVYCEPVSRYANHMSQPVHFQKVYQSQCRVDNETKLWHAPPTDKRFIHQLWERPYKGSFMGAGRHSTSGDVTDTESLLWAGLDNMTKKSCQPNAEATINRFMHLPDYGNPQRVEHTVEGWTRGGDHTRDLVRRVNHERYLDGCTTSFLVNRRNAPYV